MSQHKKKISTARANMIQRCTNPNSNSYHSYGGRGITVCQDWLDPEKGPENFYQWSISQLGFVPEEELKYWSLDRINNDRPYFPSNCIWTNSWSDQCVKRRSKGSKTGVRGVYKTANGKYYGEFVYKGVTYRTRCTFPCICSAARARNAMISRGNFPNLLSIIPENCSCRP
jgi:hypothetical protein